MVIDQLLEKKMKYWKIIACNLRKPVGVWAGSEPLIPTGEQSGLQTRMAKESVSLCAIAALGWIPLFLTIWPNC
ncbi:MAG: hypothetical protein DME80_13210 [Verrucomicrobia bacterium]|nr:MAG: hypothetical protein DME80_13210 [Verrucomicrobiota bacterium]